ncbi:MAG: amino acid ABC transporter permease [Chloroflexota bacterium]
MLGASLDVWMTIIGFALACAIGLIVAVMRLSGLGALAVPAYIYIQIMRGIPLYVFLLLVYYGLATISGLAFSPIQAMIVTLALTGSGYTAEIFRGGIEAVDRGHVEAAHSLGMGNWSTFRDVVFPQTVRLVVPPLGNTLVGLFKGATIASVIAVPDMVFLAMDVNTTFFRPFEAFGAVAVILVVTVVLFSIAITGVERVARLP